MPRGTFKRIPGHAIVRQQNGMARCECGWGPTNPKSIGQSVWKRSKHLAQVRLDLAERGTK